MVCLACAKLLLLDCMHDSGREVKAQVKKKAAEFDGLKMDQMSV